MQAKRTHHASGTVMGGPWQIRHVPAAHMVPELVAQAALNALRLVDAQMSTYRDDSDLLRLNAAPIGVPVPVPADMLTVMACADRLARQSGGALNIGLGQAVNRWGFGPLPTPGARPDPRLGAADATLAQLGSYTLHSDPPAVTKHSDIAFDLCALAKGFAVDQAARAVEALGITNYLIEAAGEIIARGRNGAGEPWTIGLELPVPGDDRIIFDQIALDGMAAATSGNYRNRRTIAGETVSHTIDPNTGEPLASDLLSVTVLHSACMEADALATVLTVLGPDQGPRFAQSHGIAALFMIRVPAGLKEIRSDAFAAQSD
ncbi:FAD:protein FMN transferase [Pseudoprimorskyibacter insulae]|uniref:FAD:protein FMN transferase n=1 Tax=Pseudoprimorskyibacter insulae TaxID=1695997 RepID=A0A2R8B0C8_9RHOB|nr:FAD:protein FMN transferase [Pseudoprimorskyibacter insulae]SPF81742.1 FAD:protein FMN transferase [Pseudoprimorskyibacter insulae]